MIPIGKNNSENCCILNSLFTDAIKTVNEEGENEALEEMKRS